MADLTCSSVAVRFGGLQALDDVDLEVPGGSVTGLIGPNGAGKTTLFNVVNGLQPPDNGLVRLDGEDITRLRPARRAKKGLARTFQRLELFGSLSARENVQMAAETQRRKLPAGVSPLAQAEILLDKVGIRHVADEPTDALPTGLARLVELARAVATSPTVLLLDEPSAGLDHAETASLGRVLSDLAADGMAVLLVEHDMTLVMSVCSRVTVLDFGQVIASGDPASVKADPAVQAAYLGTEGHEGTGGGDRTEVRDDARRRDSTDGRDGDQAAADADRDSVEASVRTQRTGEAPALVCGPGGDGTKPAPLLELRDVRAAYGRIEVVHGVSLDVAQGSVVVLLGPNGAGKSTLLKVISGLLPATAGTVKFAGHYTRRTPARLAKRGLCTIPEGRAIFPNLTVAENLRMYTYRGPNVTTGMLEERSYERFPLLAHRRRQLAGTLSGGEQQMLALARALYTEPQLLLLDELSMGLAPLVVAQLYEAVGQLVERESLTVLLVEQFATTALSVADHACIMVTGEIVERGEPAEIGRHLTGAYLGAAS